MPPALTLAARIARRLVAPDESPFPLAQPSPAAAYLATLATSSQATQAAALKALAALLGRSDPYACPWERLSYAHVAALRARLIEHYAPATSNRMLAALRGVLLACRRLGLISADQQAQLCDVPPVRGTSRPRGRMLPPDERAALFRACAADPSPRGRRDAAIFALGFYGGLRRAELSDLDCGDILDDAAQIAVGVRCGKGSKDRTVWVGGTAARLAQDWRRERGAGRALFVAISCAGRILDDRRLTPAAVRSILLRRCIEAGIPTATPHDMRRTFVSRLLDAGADIARVATLAGHASTETTRRYDRRGDDALRAAAALISDVWE
jgi:integrase